MAKRAVRRKKFYFQLKFNKANFCCFSCQINSLQAQIASSRQSALVSRIVPTPLGKNVCNDRKLYFSVKISLLFPIFKHQEEELSEARDELNKLREDETKLEREVRNNDLIKWGKMLCLLFLSFLFFYSRHFAIRCYLLPSSTNSFINYYFLKGNV